LPAFGILALLVGITLIIISYRNRTNATLAAQTSPSPSAPVPVATSYAYAPPASTPTPRSKSSPTPTPSDPNDPLGIDRFLAENPQYKSTPPPDTVRYDTGTNLMRPLSASGHGVLHIMNGTKYDAIAKLVDSRTNLTVRSVYIQANADHDIANISSGDYSLKFALGSDYNVDTGRFLYSESFMKFDEGFDFHEYRTSDGIEWTDYNVTLHGVIGGNVHASRISASEFYDR
jgi:hypothetical protein